MADAKCLRSRVSTRANPCGVGDRFEPEDRCFPGVPCAQVSRAATEPGDGHFAGLGGETASPGFAPTACERSWTPSSPGVTSGRLGDSGAAGREIP